MSFAAWERSAFMRPWLPVRAWRRLVLRAKVARFNRRRSVRRIVMSALAPIFQPLVDWYTPH